MTTKSEKNVIIVITIAAALIVAAIFIMNGAEKDDAWLYLISILSVLAIPILSYPKKSKDKE
jgi:hypothetical protein